MATTQGQNPAELQYTIYPKEGSKTPNTLQPLNYGENHIQNTN